MEHATLFQVTITPEWSQAIVEFLTEKVLPTDWTKARCKALQIEAEKYTLIQDQLYKRGPNDQLRLCAHENEYIPLLEQAHGSIAGGHFSAERTIKIILTAGIWWPTLHEDIEEFVKRCDEC